MQNAETVEAPEVTDIDGQQLCDAVDIHAGCQSGVMDLHTLTSRARQRSCTSRLSGRNSKSRSITRARRSVSATLKPKPFLSSGLVEAFQNSPNVCEV
jgi:hypothetical protein